jgi:hypothetical protein
VKADGLSAKDAIDADAASARDREMLATLQLDMFEDGSRASNSRSRRRRVTGANRLMCHRVRGRRFNEPGSGRPRDEAARQTTYDILIVTPTRRAINVR